MQFNHKANAYLKMKVAARLEVFERPGGAPGSWDVVTAIRPWTISHNEVPDIALISVINNEYPTPFSYADFKAELTRQHCEELLLFWEEWSATIFSTSTTNTFLQKLTHLHHNFIENGAARQIAFHCDVLKSFEAALFAAQQQHAKQQLSRNSRLYIDSESSTPRSSTSQSVTDLFWQQRPTLTDGPISQFEELCAALAECGRNVYDMLHNGPFLNFAINILVESSSDCVFGDRSGVYNWLVCVENLGTYCIVNCHPDGVPTKWRHLLVEKEPVLKLDPEHGIPYRPIKGRNMLPFVTESAINALSTELQARPSDVFVGGIGFGATMGHLLLTSMLGLQDGEGSNTATLSLLEAALSRQGRTYLAEIESWTHRRCFKTHCWPDCFPTKPGPNDRLTTEGAKIVIVARNPLASLSFAWQTSVHEYGYTGSLDQFVDFFLSGKVPNGDVIDYTQDWYDASLRFPDQVKLIWGHEILSSPLRTVQELNQWGDFQLSPSELAGIVKGFTLKTLKHTKCKEYPSFYFKPLLWDATTFGADPRLLTRATVAKIYHRLERWPVELQQQTGPYRPFTINCNFMNVTVSSNINGHTKLSITKDTPKDLTPAVATGAEALEPEAEVVEAVEVVEDMQIHV